MVGILEVDRFRGDHSVSSEFRSVLHYSHAGSLSGCTPLPPFLWIPPGFNLIMLSHKVGGGVASLVKRNRMLKIKNRDSQVMVGQLEWGGVGGVKRLGERARQPPPGVSSPPLLSLLGPLLF
ncbi:hypothetical protein NQZ68_000389 [Dissostichus eleginoides]|nr:hypothetical protein NQZ68_000389 [Dissostichus eleginoides]